MTSKPAKARERAERAEQALAAKAEQERRRRRRKNLNMLSVVVVMALVIGVAYVIVRSTSQAPATDGVPAAGQSDYSLAVGDPDAPHQIIVYEDFLCPFCGDLEAASGERLAELAAAGEVYLDYRPYNLLGFDGGDVDPESYSARSVNALAVVLEATDAETAKTFHDLLYADQPAESDETMPDDDWLVDKAVEAGASEDDVRPGIEDGAQMAWVEGASDEARSVGVQGTPTVLLDGQDVRDYDSMQDLADQLVAAVE